MDAAPATTLQRRDEVLRANAWKPGQSGNPRGRQKGSRNKLGEAFIDAIYEDFQAHGAGVIGKVRDEKPDQYLKVIASILPKELEVGDRLGALIEEALFERDAPIEVIRWHARQRPLIESGHLGGEEGASAP